MTQLVVAIAVVLLLGVVCAWAVAALPAGPESGKLHTYKKTPQGDLQAEVFLPPAWKASDRRPGIVFFFGGAWRIGERRQFHPQCRYFAARGLVAITCDYRIQTTHQTTPDKCVQDARSALRWVKAHAAELGVDPERLIASGGSAGGHLAACVALCPGPDDPADDRSVSPRPAALVLFNPVMDTTGQRHVERMPGSADQKKQLAEMISPNAHLTPAAPPMVVFYGTEDRLNAGGFETLRRSATLGNRVELFLAPGQPHGFFNRSPWLEATLAKADEFLAALGYVQGPPTIQAPPGAVLRQARPGDAPPQPAGTPPAK